MESFVDVLADRVGIESSFLDAAEQERQTPPETKQALLKAMGWDAATEEQAEASLKHLDEAQWQRALPACVVLYADRAMTVPVCLEPNYGQVRWTVELEDGGTRSGETAFQSLELVDRGELAGEPREHRLLVLEDLPWGYHCLRLAEVDGETSLIVTPGRCWLPGESTEADAPGEPQALKTHPEAGGRGKAEVVPFPGSEEESAVGVSPVRQPDGGEMVEAKAGRQSGGGAKERFWGVAAQVYLLRSERNWGIGDYTDLRRFVEIVRAEGAEAVGVNPLHGMFLDLPEQASPYSPLSRYSLNSLNLDVEAIPEFARCEAANKLVAGSEFLARLQRCREATMVAYEEVAALKLPVLQALFIDFERGASAERKAQFEAFLCGCDELLRVSCLFAAIRQYLTDQNHEYRDLARWPEAFQHAKSHGVREFAKTHAELVRYHLWLQWVADEQMTAVRQACEGMAVGVYRDLAVGASPSGAEVWSNPDVMVSTAEVGAPPDEWNAAGQNWALPPFHPQRMKEDGYRSFIALLRTNMRHAGGLRIDHAMALQRLYWIPRGGSPRDGGYVRYPIDDLVGVIALESQRNRCLVVGEDLGTVAKGFRERMAEANVLSYRVLLLERAKKDYVPLAMYPEKALSTASSHDLPTLRGWWEGVDTALRERLGLTKPENVDKAREEREADRHTLVKLLQAEGLLQAEPWPTTESFIDAAHRFLLRTPAVLMMAQLEDIVEEAEQVNLPASMPDQYPSWSRRVAEPLERFTEDRRLKKLAAMAREERGSDRNAS